MCDYSAKSAKQRAAAQNDVLVSRAISPHTRGFVDSRDPSTAVCLLPGTELAFMADVKLDAGRVLGLIKRATTLPYKVARFRQVDKQCEHVHHDTLEFPDGSLVKLNELVEGQVVTVLQLPAAPKSASETEDQRRAAYV